VSVRKSTAAVVCAAAVAAGAVVAATPASAGGPGAARYNCGPYGTTVSITYAHPVGSPLTMVPAMGVGYPWGTVATSTLNGVGPGPSGTVGPGTLALSGAFATLTSAPVFVAITFTSPGGVVLGIANCSLLAGSQSGSWPV
jgi:hypothetical protein